MKSLTAVLLASLCLFAHATTLYETPAFVQFKSEPFGMSLASLVQVNMSTEQSGRLNAINEVLNTVATSLTEQQSSNESTIQGQRGWCGDELSSLNGQLSTAQTDLATYQDEDESLAEEKVSEEQHLASEEQDLSTNSSNKATAESDLADEEVRNAQAVKDYAEAIAACEKSLQLLASLQSNPTSFIQTKTKFGNVVVLLQKHLANSSSPLVAPVISILAELASSSQEVDQDKLSKIVSLINQLLEELRRQEAQNVVLHNTVVEELNVQIASLTTLIAQNEVAIEQHTSRLAAIADRQTQLVSIIGNLQSLIPLLEEGIRATTDTCNGYEATYTSNKNTLDSQVATLEKIREYFNQHIVTSVSNIDDEVYNDSLSA